MTLQPDPEMKSTGVDQDDENLANLGYSQQLKRNFSTTSMLALCVSLMATWEALCSTIIAGLISGGPVSLVYGAMAAFIGSMCSAMSLAEMASIYTTAGGQYHFVAKLSPRPIAAISSWVAGYISMLGWIAVAGSAPFLAGTMIQSLLAFNLDGQYTSERWHGTMLYWAILISAACVAIFCNRILPLIQNISMALHVALFIILVSVMCAVSPTTNSAEFVFTRFVNNSGWSSDGIAWCVGLLSSCYVLIGYDGAIHLSEEMHNASKGVPQAMVGSVLLNSILGFAFLLAVLFKMGSIESVLDSQSGFPIIQVWYNMTGSKSAATVMSCAVVLMATLSTIPLVASAGRTMWAFARDQGLPFSDFIAKVERKRNIPTPAIIITVVALMLLGLVNIGSTTAFNAILSLAVVGLQVSYLMPISLMLWRRLASPETLSWGPWRLGKAGVPVNVIAVLYLTFTSIFLLFPPYRPITAQNMNYASLVFGAMLLFGLLYWFLGGKRKYAGPLVNLDIVEAVAVGNTNTTHDGKE
ncbi:hypothetical protein FDECE_374 [Fusarium decemcellulare]|nr:hypothetical protein FDECE_374 [Fusarium decemcellulare]